MEDLYRYLEDGNTCVLLRDNMPVYRSCARGIRPLLDAIDAGIDAHGLTAVDKIVGKAAAMLYLYMGVSRVYAEVMSDAARDALTARGVDCFCRVRTDKIVNRRGDDLCPMEKTVADIGDPAAALDVLRKKAAELAAAANR